MVNYLAIYETEIDEPIEVPLEEDNTIHLSTITGIFPTSSGLKYKTATGTLRCLKQVDSKIYPPEDGWTDKKIICVFPKDSKRKFDVASTDGISAKLKRLDEKKCTDLIILNLAWRTDENDLRRYFEFFGELVTVQIKRDPLTQNSKGYGFIRFATYESQLLCLAERHLIDGRWCDVKIPMSKVEGDKQEVNRKVHVGRINKDVTVEQLRGSFEQYGRVLDVFVPKPFRSFAFVTFDDPAVATNLVGKEIEVAPGCLSSIGSAVPKLPPSSIAKTSNQSQVAAARAAAYIAAVNNQGSSIFNGLNLDWNWNARYCHSGLASTSHDSLNLFGPNSPTAAAAMLAAQYTKVHRHNQKHLHTPH